MSAPATPLSAREQRRQALLDRQLERLDVVIEDGIAMTRALAAQVAGTGPQVIEGDVALAYSRLSRAVRQGILLQTHLLEEPEEKAEPHAKAKAKAKGEPEEMYVTWLEPEASKREYRKERVAHIVERMARSDGEPEEVVERLYAETAERLEKVDLYGDLAVRPISEVVAEICRDLGLKPDWAVLSTHPWARKEIELGRKSEKDGGEEVGWPLKDGPPPPEGWRGRWPPKAFPPWASDQSFPSRKNRPPAIADAAFRAEAEAFYASLAGDGAGGEAGPPDTG
jgi:hypothetical protein